MNHPSYQLIVNSTNADELSQKVLSLAKQFGVDLSKASPLEGELKDWQDKATEKSSPKKEAVKEVAPVEEAPAAKPSSKTLDDVKAACQKLTKVKNLDAVKAILAQFNAKKVSEINEADYGAFVAACEKEMA